MKEGSILAYLQDKQDFFDLTRHDDFYQIGDRQIHASILPNFYRGITKGEKISARPISIISATDHEMLHFTEENFGLGKQKPDELLPIPVLPADEMEILAYEIKLWNNNVRRVRRIFWSAFVVTAIIVTATISFSIYHYLNPTHLVTDAEYRATAFFNVHMCCQMGNILAMLIGVLLFRILPHTEMRKVIWLHGFLLTASCGMCVSAIVIATHKHEIYTKQESHLYSLHSWVGWMGFSILFISMITGLIFMFNPNGKLRAHHEMYGKTAFFMVSAAALIGYYERSLDRSSIEHEAFHVKPYMVNIVGSLLVIAAILLRLGISNFRFRRQPKPQWDVVVFRNMEQIENIFFEVYDKYESFEAWMKHVNQLKMGILQASQDQRSAPNSQRPTVA